MRSINQKVMAAGAAVVILCTVSAGAGAWAAFSLTDDLNGSVRTARVLRNHMQADMMHDALRADVLSAMLAATGAPSVSHDDARKSLDEHVAEFRKVVAENKELATNPAIREALSAVEAPLAAYVAGAEQMVQSAASDPAAASAGLPTFLQQFSTLEDAMGSASDAIEAAAEESVKEAVGRSELAKRLVIGLGLCGLVLAIAFVLFARRLVVAPILALAADMRRLASGDTDITLKSADRADEVGDIGRAVRGFQEVIVARAKAEADADAARRKTEAQARQSEEAEQAERNRAQTRVVEAMAAGLDHLAAGDLTFRLIEPFSGEYEKLRMDFNAAMQQLQETVSVIADNARGIHTGTSEISQAANDLSRRTEQQAATLEETAAALDEVTATVRQTADGAQRARAVMDQAKADALRSGEVVSEAVQAMGRIEHSSREISQIIGVIDEIAFQTNLLALNAGVEAARAGEAGRGFAVVASEVRALAQRSAEAAKEIKGLIATSSEEVENGVSRVGQTGETLERIIDHVGRISDLVAEISASASEQSTALGQINTAVNHMDQSTQQNAAMVEQSTAASEAIAQDAVRLTELLARFKAGDEVHRPRPREVAVRPAAKAPRHAERGAAQLQRQLAQETWEEF